MNKNNILKYVVPVVAIIVLVESVMLISKLKDRGSLPMVDDQSLQDKTTEEIKPATEAIYNIAITGQESSVKVSVRVEEGRHIEDWSTWPRGRRMPDPR